MFKKSFICLVLMLFVAAPVFAQAPAAGTQNTSESISISEEGLISLDFRDADIRNVLQILAYKSGVNIVSGPKVTGIITIRLNEVPWKRALDVILKTNGFAYEQKGNIIMVETVEDMKKKQEDAKLLAEQEPLTTEIFVLNFAKADQIRTSIEKMKSERGSIDIDMRTNTVIVTDTPGKIERITEVVNRLDTTTPQVLIEAKIVETDFNDTDNLGIDWVTKATVSGSARPTIYPFTTSSNNKYLADDIPSTEDGFTYGTLDFSQVSAVMELLRSKTNTNILSQPRIMTLDNQPAQIEVGTSYPIPSFGANEETGALQTTGIKYENIGITFTVTPHVNSAKLVVLEVQPSIKELTGTTSFQGIDVPLYSIESVTTNVMVKDGNTVVIAGLVKSKTIEVRKKTPILGDIPILGLAFQKKEDSVDKVDLMVFITPHIVTAEK